METKINPLFTFKNDCLRALCRLYPFTKGQYRLMKIAERFLDKRDQNLSNLFGHYNFLLDLKRGDLESSFYYFLPELYESGTQQYIREHVKPGMTVMDIGAHLGFFSILLGHCVGSGGKVYSFEPEKTNFDKLVYNLQCNKMNWVSPFRIALSDKSGSQKLFLHPCNSGNFLAATAGCHSLQFNPSKFQHIAAISLDEFYDQNNLSEIDLIKMDAEGSEAHILRGGKKLFASGKARKIICEIKTSRQGVSDEVRELFCHYGYRSYILDSKLSARSYLSELKPKDLVTGLQNIVFCNSSK